MKSELVIAHVKANKKEGKDLSELLDKMNEYNKYSLPQFDLWPAPIPAEPKRIYKTYTSNSTEPLKLEW